MDLITGFSFLSRAFPLACLTVLAVAYLIDPVWLTDVYMSAIQARADDIASRFQETLGTALAPDPAHTAKP